MHRFGWLTTVITLTIFANLALAEAPPPAFDGAKWIWHPVKLPESNKYPAGSIYARGTAELPADDQIDTAEILITADNLFVLHLNGKPIGESEPDPDGWRRPKRFDVFGRLLPGKNVIAVQAINTIPGASGLIVKLIARLTNGKQIEITTDESWRCSDKDAPDWQQPGFDDRQWQPARIVGQWGAGPWARPNVPHEVGAGNVTGRISEIAVIVRKGGPLPPPPPAWKLDKDAPADFRWPEGIAFLGDDCSVNRGTPGKPLHPAIPLMMFNARKSRAFSEHDLPSPVKLGRKLLALKPARPGAATRVLLDAGKGAIAAPSVSFDGKWIYFCMAAEGESFFSIYRISADGGQPQRLTRGPFHDIEPAELPDGRIVFTSTRIGFFDEYHQPPSRALFVMNADGGDIHPITHTIIFDNEPEVMADGRILFLRTDNFFDRAKVETMLHAVHPDGTEGYTEFALDKAPEYGVRLRAFQCGSPAPMPDGRVAFISSPGITIGRPGEAPDHWRHIGIEAGDVAALPDGRLLCTAAKRVTHELPEGQGKKIVHELSYEHIGIVDPQGKDARVTLLYDSPSGTVHSPVYLGARPRPPVLPERVDRAKAEDLGATGVFFCQNARFSRNATAGWPHVRAIRVIAGNGLTVRSSHSYIVHVGNETVELGTVPLAPDGSFAVEVPADTPIAFQAVDAEGRSELNEMSWVYVRPGENRGCLGCHHSRQSTPLDMANLQAMRTRPVKLLGQGEPHRYRGNNAAVTGLMELQFERFREVAGLNRHAVVTDPLATGKQEVAALVAQLGSSDFNLRISAAQRLAIFRDTSAAEALAQRLSDPVREARLAAAVALAACGTRQSVPPLLTALGDREPLVAQAAAMALENLTGHAEPFNPFAAPPERAAQVQAWRDWFTGTNWKNIEQELIQRLSGDDRDGLRRAAVTLGHVGGDDARAALRAHLLRQRERNPYPEWRKANRGDEARFNSLSPANPRPLQAVARALGHLQDAEAVALLAETATKSSNPDNGNLFLAEACIEALGRIATPEAEAALIALFGKLKDYPHCSGWYGDHGALIACHASPMHYFVAEALDAMGSKAARAIVPGLIASVPTDTDRGLFFQNDDCEALTGRIIRRSGLESAVIETCLAILGDAQAQRAPEIEAAINKVHGAWGGRPDPEHRAAHILSLACRDKRHEPRIRAAFERYRAKTTDIPRLFDDGIPVVKKLPVKHWVCFYLARTLGNLADLASVDALIAALEQSPPEAAGGRPDPLGYGIHFLHNDLTPCWRAAAAWALGRIGDKRAAPALLKVTADFSNALDTRHAAAVALGDMGDPGSTTALRALAADYPEVSTRRALRQSLERCAGASNAVAPATGR